MGFIPGRYIGEHALLVYDILHFTEEQDKPGILLLVYIVKTFNSISWMFIESVLGFFSFGFFIKQWAKTCYANITSAVVFLLFLRKTPYLSYKLINRYDRCIFIIALETFYDEITLQY